MSTSKPGQRLRPFKPQRFGKYTLVSRLATGGMGETFLAKRAFDSQADALCVIKRVLPHFAQNADFVRRFLDEARTLVQLSHHAIAQVLDVGLDQGTPYLCLEFVDGKDVRRVLERSQERGETLPLSFVLGAASQLLDGLSYAHRKRGEDGRDLNLVHRDISPQNILVGYDGRVKVIDFGLAKSTLSLVKTNPSIVLGKFRYMSPEQARHKPVDRRSDVYSVGLCLWEWVAGQNPFDDVAAGDLLARVSTPVVPSLHSIEPRCPQSLSDAVAMALAVDPEQRFQSAHEFRGELLRIQKAVAGNSAPDGISHFMHALFAAEYSAERRMFKALSKPTLLPSGNDEADASARRTIELLPESYPTPIELPIFTAETPTDQGHVTPLDFEAQSLSFSPTRQDNPIVVRNAGSSERPTPVEETPSVLVDARMLAGPQHQRSTPTALLERTRVSGIWYLVPLIAIGLVLGLIAWDLVTEVPSRNVEVEEALQSLQNDFNHLEDVETRSRLAPMIESLHHESRSTQNSGPLLKKIRQVHEKIERVKTRER
jgi:serine/threonine protein kinase